MTDRRAQQPFRFVSCMELREVLGKRAMDEQRLLEIVEEAPADSIYYHTHSYYLRHSYRQGLFPNDFATWVALHVQDRVLAEQLGVVDPFAFDDIEQLRGEILTILGEHLGRVKLIPRCSTGEPFEFVRSHIIEADLQLEARTLGEFRAAIAGVEVGAVYYHLCDARLRQGRVSGDFAQWFAADDGLAWPELAHAVVKLAHRGLSLEAMRERIVGLCDQALQAGVPPAAGG